ncbi:hypothetical protein D3C75_980900 [compost metagenome]
MAWSFLRVLIVPLSIGSMVFRRKEEANRNSYSKQDESDWNIHSDYFEMKVLNERLKKEMQDLTS